MRAFYLANFLGVILGTALVIASACVFNNYLDREIDAKMERTKKRASVTGIVSIQSGMIYATTLGVLGYAILAIWTNRLTVMLGAVAFIFYVVIYGWAKRNTVHSTLIGSVAGAIPPVAGYCAMTNKFDAGALLLFLILVCWQMPHFYSIAIYRLKDYKSAGLPVLTVKQGIPAAKKQIVFYILAFTVCVSLLTFNNYTGVIFFVAMFALNLFWLYKAILGFKVKDNNKWARKMFGYSLIMTLALSFMLSVGGWLP